MDDGTSAWSLPDLEPTNLVALWPDDRAPTVTEILRALESDDGVLEIVEELEQETGESGWAIAASVPGREDPIVIWTEEARAMAPEELQQLGADGCEWVVGFELCLSSSDPLTDYVDLVRRVARGLHDVPAILDVNTTRWFTRDELEAVFCDDVVEPPVDVLWVIHAIAPSGADPQRPQTAWLHTHGLWRCGIPELEMLEVPTASARCAAELIGDLAGLVIERQPPEPGDAFEIGTGLRVTLQPWQVVAPYVTDGAPGGMEDRVENDAHVGVRAAICAEAPKGAYKPVWTWPEEVIERLRRDEAGVYMTRRATERQSRMAQAGWGQLAMAFACWARAAAAPAAAPRVVFGVKAGFATDDGDEGREHLWFEVSSFDGDRVHAELVNQPVSVSALTRGDEMWIERGQVSDWTVMTPRGSFGPADVPALWKAIDALKEQATTSGS